jgi:methylphosphotriester-DNA--protein-cysteine methyltransferase
MLGQGWDRTKVKNSDHALASFTVPAATKGGRPFSAVKRKMDSALPEPMSWNRDEARSGRFDRAFILGVLSTGIYCLPSCAARPPRPENARVFATETEAQGAGLRACKRCRPDLFHAGRSEEGELFAGLAQRLRADLEAFPNAAALARAAGIGAGKLARLVKRQAGLTPAAWLKQERLRAAEALLRGTSLPITDIALRAGFNAQSAFHRQFAAAHGLSPAAWRARTRRAP